MLINAMTQKKTKRRRLSVPFSCYNAGNEQCLLYFGVNCIRLHSDGMNELKRMSAGGQMKVGRNLMVAAQTSLTSELYEMLQ